MAKRKQLRPATYSTREDGHILIHRIGPNGEMCRASADTEAQARASGMSANWNKNGDGKPTVNKPNGTGYWNTSRDGDKCYAHHDLWIAKHGPIPEGFQVIFRDGCSDHLEDDNLMLEENEANPHRMAARAANEAKRTALEEFNAALDKAEGRFRPKGMAAVTRLDRSLRDKAARDDS